MNSERYITVLIVDDEVLVRVGIKSLLNWEDLGFTVIGEAENGERALKMVKTFEPDLVLTDIKMPRMGGLELIRKVKNLGLKTEFIILSLYDDFSYAQKGIQLGARDYILKMEMKEESLKETLLRIRPQLRKRDKSMSKDLRDRSDLVLKNRESMLRSLIISDYSIEFGSCLHPVEKNIFCIYLRVVSIKGIIFTSDEKTGFRIPLFNLMEDVLSEFPHSFLSHIRFMEFAVLYSPESVSLLKDSKLKILELIDSFIKALNQYMNLTAIVGVAGPEHSIDCVNGLYRRARGIIEEAYVYPGGSVVIDFEKKEDNQEYSLDYQTSLNSILHRLHQIDFPGAAYHIDEFSSLLSKQSRVEKGVLKIICYKIADAFRISHAVSLKDNFLVVSKDIESLSSIDEFQCWLKRTTEVLLSLSGESAKVSPVILKAVRLLDAHYTENLTLTDVAEYLDISSGYLSQILKRELGKGFSDYLTELRIKKSSELLLKTDETVQNIAEKVGYENVYYFSRVFKARTGQSPREYRKTCIEKS